MIKAERREAVGRLCSLMQVLYFWNRAYVYWENTINLPPHLFYFLKSVIQREAFKPFWAPFKNYLQSSAEADVEV